jgi:hypothetical protein
MLGLIAGPDLAVGMELASRSLIEALADTGRAKRRHTVLPVVSAPAHRPRRCDCGACGRCLDNARWERIFREKFADPTYYRQRAPKQGSSLGWL